MGALQLAIFMLIITYFQAVDGLAQSPNKLSERLSVREELALQGNTAPSLAQLSTKADGSPYSDPQNENNPLALPLSLVDTTTSQPDLIASDNHAPCSPVDNLITGGRLKRRGRKQRRGATKNPGLTCPSGLTAPTDTDTRPSETDEQQQSQTEQKGREQEPGGHDESPKPEELNWPNLYKIPTKDGDNPACFESTNGLMPVGVCENPTRQPERSRWDVFMRVNNGIGPRAWKLPDSQLGAFSFIFIVFRKSKLINCSPHIKLLSNRFLSCLLSHKISLWSMILIFLKYFISLAWPGLRECVPRNSRGIWCCRFYTILIDGSGFGDICWPLMTIERLNSDGLGDWQQFMNPLIIPGLWQK